MIDRLRADNAKAADENARLARELDAIAGRLAERKARGSELTVLREERDLIRSRVGEMLEQIESARTSDQRMDARRRVVHVEIHGQQYPIRSGLDPAYVAELAAYVDEKMRLAVARDPGRRHPEDRGARGAEHRRRVLPRPRRTSRPTGGPRAGARELERMLDLALGLDEPQADGPLTRGLTTAGRRPQRLPARSFSL